MGIGLESARAANEPAQKKPVPAQASDALVEAKAALTREIERQRAERLGWVDKAKSQLTELEDRLLDEIAAIEKATERHARQAAFDEQKKRRLEQLDEIGTVRASAVRPIGWVEVKAGVSIDKLGYNPDC